MSRTLIEPAEPSNYLQQIISCAWEGTLATVRKKPSRMKGSTKIQNLNRAKDWVDQLARGFASRYSFPEFHVFWKSNRNRNPICGNLKELLFDIAVCQLSETKSLEAKPRSLKFISRAHWLVESEFETGNTREIILDMSKLVIGACPHKLFVAAHRREDIEQRLLNGLRPIAQCCGTGLFLAFVSHPNDWFTEQQREPAIHEWSDELNNWRPFFS